MNYSAGAEAVHSPVRQERPAVFAFPETGQTVRTVVIDGEPWWFASDVCAILDIANVGNVLARLDDDDVSFIRLTDGTLGNPNRAIVNEPGVYELVIRSDRPMAKAFRRWLTHEVLPAIRRTGSYSAPVARSEPVRTPAVKPSNRDLALMVIEEADRAEHAEAKVAELEPKAAAHDTYLVAANSERLVREVAKLLSWRERDLRAFLVAQRLLFVRHAGCGQTQYDVYAEHRTRFRPVEHVVTHGDSGPCSHYTLYVLPSGIELIRARIAKQVANELEAAR